MADRWELFEQRFIRDGAYRAVLDGLWVTVRIAFIGLLIGIVIGTVIAIVRVMPKYKVMPRILDTICSVYVGFFRGTPIMVQLLIGYFVLLPAINLRLSGLLASVSIFGVMLPPIKINLSGLLIAIIIYGMNSGAYVSEIMRGGIQSVDPGQLEAARALGLNYSVSMLKVVVPQAAKNILPTMGNELITLIKDTSVVSFIAVIDVTKAFRQIGDSTYEYIVPYLMLAAVYLIIVGFIAQMVKLIERRMRRNER